MWQASCICIMHQTTEGRSRKSISGLEGGLSGIPTLKNLGSYSGQRLHTCRDNVKTYRNRTVSREKATGKRVCGKSEWGSPLGINGSGRCVQWARPMMCRRAELYGSHIQRPC